MKFFIPNIDDLFQAERIYDAIKKYNFKLSGWEIKNRRIYSLSYTHKNRKHTSTVGEIEPDIGEPVIAILENSKMFIVCTQNRGVVNDVPLSIGYEEISSVVDFDL